ncbi:BREX system P-loop protein BrxC [Proteiniclasticum ruminis]|uniref:BREX system P-loop protein BrxC n=1 Tax=Proteiniclasticum ruminis TaxID=398199 RepID=A0A1I5EYF3_9CLOT|nr:BREX system P-loop protein BrxC [Proteiniclasticum ruminis]SFO16463.1 hypothetical protein SAMN04488695_1237 [Proteiniclasticum ruminis]
MLIRDMFTKAIDRDIKGVIKVGQEDEQNIRQELEEYVVTRELQKHFADFFSSYKRGINGPTDKMGVWISGFFGSGKSHFLKILSHLLENKVVDGKHAIEYFEEDKKIIDPMVLADMKLAAKVPTDVILFNIDSKSQVSSQASKDGILQVFLKVFNEMQGFSGSSLHLADLERHLTIEGKYERFKEVFAERYGASWVESRHKFHFIQDAIVDALVQIEYMTDSAARTWFKQSVSPYQLSIDSFAKMVKKYVDSKGPNHHVVFLVDEIGQYIGDDSKLMLNLQTVTEDLGTACQGKVWVIVTSQQDIDSITKTKGNDFSKIQGRFDTRLSLSAANVDEVVKKRILDKTTTAGDTLRILYEQKATIIKNLIVFNDGVEKKLYANDLDFASVYPFVTYQFNLLGSVLTSIRTHGASGKHLSEGERSMLALFKESTMKLMNQEHGALVPFNMFYDALHQFLDHTHKGVISKALDNEIINPDKTDNCFTVNVLKTLFMIKYVKEITANEDNITSLMVSDIDTDRIALKKQVVDSLTILVRQMLVQKNGDLYVFLTDEEQEINREIEGQHVDPGEVISKVSEIIFEEIFSEKKYRYPAHNNRYNFAFNQKVDDRPYKSNQNNDISVNVITPYYEGNDEEISLRMKSGQGKEVLVVLPNDSAFLNEIQSVLKIEKYLRVTTSNRIAKFDQIKDAKRSEMRVRSGNAKVFLQESMKNASIYVNGDKVQSSSKDVSSKVLESVGKLVETLYHKLPYIEVAMSEANIRSLFKVTNQQSIILEGQKDANKNALEDMLNMITVNSSRHTKTSMKSLMDHYMKAPYGFIEDDVEWLVAKLFKDGNISITINGENITTLNRTDDEIVRYLTKKEYVEKLLTELRQRSSFQEKKAVKEVMKELFNVSTVSDDDDTLMESFKKYAQSMIHDIERFESESLERPLPGKKVLSDGKKLLLQVKHTQTPSEFFKLVKSKQDDFIDFAEYYEPVKAFYSGDQKGFFVKSLKLMSIYEASKNFVVDGTVEKLAKEISGIIGKENPYSDISKLPKLNVDFENAYNEILEQEAIPIYEAIEDAKKYTLGRLDSKPYKEDLRNRFEKGFEGLKEKANSCNNVAILQSIKLEADALKMRLLDEIDTKDQVIRETEEQYGDKSDQADDTNIKTILKAYSLKSISTSTTWIIKSEEDIEEYLEKLRTGIRSKIEENTIIHISL